MEKVMDEQSEFQRELTALLNRYSLEGKCGDTPDFILANYLSWCLFSFGAAVAEREKWYGRNPERTPVALNS